MFGFPLFQVLFSVFERNVNNARSNTIGPNQKNTLKTKSKLFIQTKMVFFWFEKQSHNNVFGQFFSNESPSLVIEASRIQTITFR